MRDLPDIYSRLKAQEGQACAGKWLFNTGPLSGETDSRDE